MPLPRKNLLQQPEETWRPPLLQPPTTSLRRITAAIRRFFDVQFGSIWNDMQALLADSTGTLLDVGCGAQPLRPLVPSTVRYIGIDTVDAETYFGYKIPDTLYFAGEVWPIESASIDTILCTETLEHVLLPETLLTEAARVLLPHGRLLMTVPFSARWHFIPHDYWRYTPSSLKYLLEKNGFQDIVVYARGNEWTVACYKVMALYLPLLFNPVSANPLGRFFERCLGLLCLPLILVSAIIANLSLLSAGGNDCLGFTVEARRMGSGS